MAGDWIKFDHTTPDKPEVVMMAAALRIDQDAVVGKLIRVWLWADQNISNGERVVITDAFIDRLVHHRGFASAMRSANWLSGAAGSLTFPNFGRHNGATAKGRALENRRKASQRERDKCPEDVPLNVTDPPGQTPGPEKRREEKKVRQSPKPPSPSAQAGDARHHEICSRWGDAYQSAFDVKYSFARKDAATLKRFLATNSDSSDTILAVAAQAWARGRADRYSKRAKEAATIHGLCTFYNDIRVELQTPQSADKSGQAVFAH